MDDMKMSEQTSESVSRRGFIKGVIAAGAVASSSAYLFRTTPLHGQPSAPGSVERLITLNVNGQDRRVDVMKQETGAANLLGEIIEQALRVRQCGHWFGHVRGRRLACRRRASTSRRAIPVFILGATIASVTLDTDPAAQALFADFLAHGHRYDVPIIPMYDTGTNSVELIAEHEMRHCHLLPADELLPHG